VTHNTVIQLAQTFFGEEDAVVENILQWLLIKGEEVEIFNVSGLRWLEVDNQGFAKCRKDIKVGR